MTEPGEYDCVAWTGTNMLQRWINSRTKNGEHLWSAGLDGVRENMYSTGYPQQLIEFKCGDVCNVLDKREGIPGAVALLRLDTDWYESTKKELGSIVSITGKKGYPDNR